MQTTLCTFPFTAATYREMLATLCHVSSRKWAQNIRKDLPVLLIAGTADPVGDYGAGVRKVWAMLGGCRCTGPELRNLARCPP